VTTPLAPTTFPGFPAGARATAVPSAFFSDLLPQIEDEAELRVTLYVIYALGRRKGYPRFVTANELRAETPLVASLEAKVLMRSGAEHPERFQSINGDAPSALDRLQRGLYLAVERASLLSIEVDNDGRVEALYFLNTPADRRAVDLIRDGRLELGRALPAKAGAPASQRGNLFQLYEENIGPLTPLVAEELREAEQLYPYEWLEEALREAALLNKRSWRYASRILQRWATEGRKRETPGRDSDAGNSARAQFIRRNRQLFGEE
jgi:DnaD/phage-associated family protein